MTVNEMLILARQRLGDMQKTMYSDTELIYCLNQAIDRVSAELANNFDPEITQTMVINGQEVVKRPDNFISFQGQYPVQLNYNDGEPMMQHLDPEFDGELEIRYFATMNHVKSLTDEIPFTRRMFQKQLLTYILYEARPSLEQNATSATPKAGE